MRWLTTHAPVVIDGHELRPDSAVAERLAQRQEEARKALGARWAAHPINRVLSPKQRAAINHANNVCEITRKKA